MIRADLGKQVAESRRVAIPVVQAPPVRPNLETQGRHPPYFCRS